MDRKLIKKKANFKTQCVHAGELVDKVNGGSISIGHPFGMTGSRQVGHIVRELERQDKQFGVVTMCVGGGMGASGLFERYPN